MQVEELHAAIEAEGVRLGGMTHAQIVHDRHDFLSEVSEHPSGESWGEDWPAELAAALRNAAVRKRHEVAGHSMLTCGKVVGCVDRFFQVRSPHHLLSPPYVPASDLLSRTRRPLLPGRV